MFHENIIQNKNKFLELTDYHIEQLDKNYKVKKVLKDIFFSIKLTANKKPLLVTFAKTMHFFLNNLIVPIDRTYIIKYFTNKTDFSNNINDQWELFIEIEKEFSKFSNEIDLEIYVNNDRWNLCKTKIMDNMIIGLQNYYDKIIVNI